jgi:hypothetical protein
MGQGTILAEFGTVTDPASSDLLDKLGLGQHDNNGQRIHGALGTTPRKPCLALLL